MRKVFCIKAKFIDVTVNLLPRHDHRHSPLQTHKIQRHAAKILDRLSPCVV